MHPESVTSVKEEPVSAPQVAETDAPEIEFIPAAEPPKDGTRCRSRSKVIRNYLE